MSDVSQGDWYRVLVTGSRDWAHICAIADALDQVIAEVSPRPVLVVHGACPTGADRQAEHYVRWLKSKECLIDVERHPAENFGLWPRCGPIRNRHMVDLGAGVCLAFIGPCTSSRCRRPDPHPSHGASGCASLAEKAGIPTRRFTP